MKVKLKDNVTYKPLEQNIIYDVEIYDHVSYRLNELIIPSHLFDLVTDENTWNTGQPDITPTHVTLKKNSKDFIYIKYGVVYSVISENLDDKTILINAEDGNTVRYHKKIFSVVKNPLTDNKKDDTIDENMKGEKMKVKLKNQLSFHYKGYHEFTGEYELIKETETGYFIRGPKGRYLAVEKDYFIKINDKGDDMGKNKHKNKFNCNDYVVVSNESDVWETKIDVISQCSKAPEKMKVVIYPLANLKIKELMKMFTNIEWLAYMIGEKTNNHFIIKDLLIPKQEISSGSVDNIEFTVPEGTPLIGVIHSHHHMGAGFSGTDENWINQNHDLSIVVSHSAMKAKVRWKTPCGGLHLMEADIVFDYGLDWDKESFKKEVEENIKERSFGMFNYQSGSWRKDWDTDNLPLVLRGQNNKTDQTLEDDLKSDGMSIAHYME